MESVYINDKYEFYADGTMFLLYETPIMVAGGQKKPQKRSKAVTFYYVLAEAKNGEHNRMFNIARKLEEFFGLKDVELDHIWFQHVRRKAELHNQKKKEEMKRLKEEEKKTKKDSYTYNYETNIVSDRPYNLNYCPYKTGELNPFAPEIYSNSIIYCGFPAPQ